MSTQQFPSPPAGQTARAKTSGFAIASLVCGLLGFLILPALAGLILGIMAIRQVNRSNGAIGGKGLAIGGVVVSSLAMVVAVAFVGLSFIFG